MNKITVAQSKQMCKKLNGNRRGISAPWCSQYSEFYIDLPSMRIQVIPNYYEKGLWGVEVIHYCNNALFKQEYKNIPTNKLEYFILLTYMYLTAGNDINIAKISGIGEKV